MDEPKEKISQLTIYISFGFIIVWTILLVYFYGDLARAIMILNEHLKTSYIIGFWLIWLIAFMQAVTQTGKMLRWCFKLQEQYKEQQDANRETTE